MASFEVRIIGGKWRGRKLVFPDRRDLRPTLGRVRETLFNWLRADIEGSRCLDLFAGSGALGFEAASLGAESVTLVERDRRAAQALRDNAERLRADNVTVLWDAAERALSRDLGPWDVIFLDPPFHKVRLSDVLEQVEAAGALATGGVIYVEGPGTTDLPTHVWRLVKESRAGDTRFGLLAAP